MVERVPLYLYLPILLISLCFSFFEILRILWKTITIGPRKLFYVKKRERPAVLDNPGFGTHHFATLKTVKLHYVMKGPEDKPLMLFLHGLPEFWYSWRHQIREFSKDFRTVAVDMRGYGESEKPDGVINYTLDKLVADIKELLPILGYDTCYLVAHDWGGAVSWAFAQMYPSMVTKLIICNCPHMVAFKKHLPASFEQMKKSWYMAFFQTPWLPEISLRCEDMQWLEDVFWRPPLGMIKPDAMTDEDMEAFKYNYCQPKAFTGPVNYLRAGFTYKTKALFLTDKVQVPTLMIWGTVDGAFSKPLAELSGEYVEDYTVKYVDNVSHWVQQEEPQIVNGHIRDFLARK